MTFPSVFLNLFSTIPLRITRQASLATTTIIAFSSLSSLKCQLQSTFLRPIPTSFAPPPTPVPPLPRPPSSVPIRRILQQPLPEPPAISDRPFRGSQYLLSTHHSLPAPVLPTSSVCCQASHLTPSDRLLESCHPRKVVRG